MKVLPGLFFLSHLFTFIFLSVGCASITTWEKTGVEIYRINDAEIKKMEDGSFQLVQNVSVMKEYLPFLHFFSKISEGTNIYSYPGKNKIKNSTSYEFLLKPDNKSTILSMGKGFLFCKKHLSPMHNTENLLRDSDISLLKNYPFVVRNLVSCKDVFLIPYDVVPCDNGVLELRCYSPLSPPVILGSEGNNTYKNRMEGTGITLLRIALLPVPVIIDMATLPFQAIGLLLVYSLRC